MSEGTPNDETAGRRSPEFAEEMFEEARRSAVGDDEPAGCEGAVAGDDVMAEEPEPGTIADTGQPAGTADAHAAGVMDTSDEERS